MTIDLRHRHRQIESAAHLFPPFATASRARNADACRSLGSAWSAIESCIREGWFKDVLLRSKREHDECLSATDNAKVGRRRCFLTSTFNRSVRSLKLDPRSLLSKFLFDFEDLWCGSSILVDRTT